jgi:hypothetical protein
MTFLIFLRRLKWQSIIGAKGVPSPTCVATKSFTDVMYDQSLIIVLCRQLEMWEGCIRAGLKWYGPCHFSGHPCTEHGTKNGYGEAWIHQISRQASRQMRKISGAQINLKSISYNNRRKTRERARQLRRAYCGAQAHPCNCSTGVSRVARPLRSWSARRSWRICGF